jgi:hypothetical protein
MEKPTDESLAEWVLPKLAVLSMVGILAAPVFYIGHVRSGCNRHRLEFTLGLCRQKEACPHCNSHLEWHSGDLYFTEDLKKRMDKLETLLPAAKGYKEFTLDTRLSGIHFSLKGDNRKKLEVTIPNSAIAMYYSENKPYLDSDSYAPWWWEVLNARIH